MTWRASGGVPPLLVLLSCSETFDWCYNYGVLKSVFETSCYYNCRLTPRKDEKVMNSSFEVENERGSPKRGTSTQVGHVLRDVSTSEQMDEQSGTYNIVMILSLFSHDEWRWQWGGRNRFEYSDCKNIFNTNCNHNIIIILLVWNYIMIIACRVSRIIISSAWGHNRGFGPFESCNFLYTMSCMSHFLLILTLK